MTVTATLERNAKLTSDQINEIRAASAIPITYDEDSPRLTPAMEKAFRLAAMNRNRYKATAG